MVAVAAVVEKLLEGSPAAAEAGEILLRSFSNGQLAPEQFIADTSLLSASPHFVSRYLTQVTLRALTGGYESVDDVIASLQALESRNAPVLEPGRRVANDRITVSEARVIDLRGPLKVDSRGWVSAIDAVVTSGPLHGEEIQIRLSSGKSPLACLLVSRLWLHATIAAYNLVPSGERSFDGCADTFLVIEPMRQINATSVARSLHCGKPQLDQMRRGKGDVTVPTLKGILVHALFDRLLEEESDLEALYQVLFPRTIVLLASVTDDFFNEDAFRTEVLRHAGTLKAFIDANPHLRKHAQIEMKRYSATIGIQGRIDAVFLDDNHLDIVELKTGAKIRPEDHAQLFIYRLLLSDLTRRWQRSDGREVAITASLLCSSDGSSSPLQIQTDFFRVIDARNKLLAAHYALGLEAPHFKFRYEGFNKDVCGSCASWTRKRCRETSTVFGDRPDSPQPAELEYFRRFTRLVERERWTAEQDVLDLLDDSRMEIRKKSFRALTGVRILDGAEPFTFEFAENTSDISVGDGVLIHAGSISSESAFHGHVRAVESGSLRISIPLKNLSPRVFEGRDWVIDRLPLDVTAEASHTALYDFLVSPMDSKKEAILGLRSAGKSEDLVEFPRDRSPQLNSSQLQAIDRALNCGVFHLIWGPPGTGKTRVIPEIAGGVNGPVLLGAFTNTAVDKMLIALLDEDPTVRFLRMGKSSESPDLARRLKDPAEYFSEDLAAKYQTVKAVRQAMRDARIVAATAHRASTLPYLRRRAFEMAIVDEAAQLTEPLTLGLILRSRRFILIGDDRQLPPVVRARGLGVSMFERLKQDSEQKRDGSLTLLDTQYRMHPDIMAVSNTLFYGGRLRSGVRAQDRLPPDGKSVILLPVEGVSARNTDGRRNPAEAEVVLEVVRRLTGDYGVSASSIGVVSPFRAQVALLRRLLAGTGVTVDTIERFQGGERDVMILSLVRSQGSGFVFDERRFNVAITRARRKLVFVAHPDLFRNSRYEWICTFIETPKTAGAI